MLIKSEKGVSAVEFALIAPLLFVLTFGIIEFAILLFDKAVVTNASREGARAAIVFNVDEDGGYAPLTKAYIQGVVTSYFDGLPLVSLGADNTPVITVDYENGEAVSGEDVTVTVTYTYTFLVFRPLLSLIGGDFTDGINLVGTTLMRME